MRAVGNTLWIDTSDYSISFYYNSDNDFRGNTTAAPLVNLFRGGTISTVKCISGSAPTDNCTTLVPEVSATVGEFDYFNMFGRDTAPGNNCSEMGLTNQPCNQYITIGTNNSGTTPSRISGTWFYFPWGFLAFASNLCSPIPASPLGASYFSSDDSWTFAGRIWARTILACGQNHFRVPPSSSASFSQLTGAANTAQTTYIGWSGIDWVARSTTTARQGFSLN